MATIQPRVTSSATMISKKPRKDKISIYSIVLVIKMGGLGIPEWVAPPLRDIKAKTVAIMGHSGAGKTTWLSRFTYAVQKRHKSIICGAICGAMIYPIDFTSNRGTFRMNVLDVPHDINPNMVDPLMYGVDAFVMMFDLHSVDPFPGIRFRHERIKSLKNLGEKPVLLCGNKADISSVSRLQRASSASRFARHEKFKWYFEISALANHRIIEPFLYAAQLAYCRVETAIAAILRRADNVLW